MCSLDSATMNQRIVGENKQEIFDIRRWREEAGFHKRAELELGETPELKKKTIRQLEDLLRSQDEFRPRMDDDYLLRFLRAKKFDVDKTFKLIRHFYRCRLIDPNKFAPIGVGPRDLQHIFNLRGGLIVPTRNPIDGTVILILRLGNWKPDSGITPIDTYTPMAMAFDLVQQNPEVQLYGFRMIIDLQGLQWWHLKYLQPHVLKALCATCQDGYPARFKGAHILNNSYTATFMYTLCRPFINTKVRSRIHLHGADVVSLHRFIVPDILPEEYGGSATDDMLTWFLDELLNRHDDYVRYSHYGYNVAGNQPISTESLKS